MYIRMHFPCAYRDESSVFVLRVFRCDTEGESESYRYTCIYVCIFPVLIEMNLLCLSFEYFVVTQKESLSRICIHVYTYAFSLCL